MCKIIILIINLEIKDIIKNLDVLNFKFEAALVIYINIISIPPIMTKKKI